MRIYDFNDVPLSDTEFTIVVNLIFKGIDFSCDCGVLSANRLAVSFFGLQNRQENMEEILSSVVVAEGSK